MFGRKTELTMCALHISLLLDHMAEKSSSYWEAKWCLVHTKKGHGKDGGKKVAMQRQLQPACGAISCLHRFQLVSVARSHGQPTGRFK